MVATPSDANFKELLYGDLWNRGLTVRFPQILIRVNDDQDIVIAIRLDRENKLKVVVRGGGHNWCQPTLRHGGMPIDLINLNKVISIDPIARKAIVQPTLSNRDAQKALNAQGMAFPCDHCASGQTQRLSAGRGMGNDIPRCGIVLKHCWEYWTGGIDSDISSPCVPQAPRLYSSATVKPSGAKMVSTLPLLTFP